MATRRTTTDDQNKQLFPPPRWRSEDDPGEDRPEPHQAEANVATPEARTQNQAPATAATESDDQEADPMEIHRPSVIPTEPMTPRQTPPNTQN